jgi:hypothetical protein
LLACSFVGATPASATKIFAFGAKPNTSFVIKKNNVIVATTTSTALGRVRIDVGTNPNDRFDMLSANPPTPVTPTVPALSLDQNYPNPFNPSTRIPFTLESADRVLLRIYDVRGAHVATVFDGNLGLGRHSFEWSGRDDAGQPVASGVYLYTLTTHQQTLSKKMLVVK